MYLGPLIICTCFACVVAILGVVDVTTQRKRPGAWQQLADEIGFCFLGNDNDVLTRYSRLKTFSQGADRRFDNAIQGVVDDMLFTIGDYHAYRGEGGGGGFGSTTCVVEMPSEVIPRCYLRPQLPFFDDVRVKLGYQDINFEDDPEFSNAYLLEGKPKAVVESLFDVEVRRWFTERKDQLAAEMRDHVLVLHRHKQLVPEEVKQFMQDIIELGALLTRGAAK